MPKSDLYQSLKKENSLKNLNKYSFEFDEPAEAITKGQACVLYDQ